MLRGDLADAPLSSVLRELAAQRVTGSLLVTGRPAGPTGATGTVETVATLHLHGGDLSTAVREGVHGLVGPRLVALAGVPAEALAEAEAAKARDLHGWRTGEILVHLGYVEEHVVEAASREDVVDLVGQLADWQGSWKLRRGDRSRGALAEPLVIEELLDELAARRVELAALTAGLGVPALGDAVPVPAGRAAGLGAHAAALLTGLDGARTLSTARAAIGLSSIEGARALAELVGAGAVRALGDEAPAAAPATSVFGLFDTMVAESDADHETLDEDPLSRVAAALAALSAPADDGADAVVFDLSTARQERRDAEAREAAARAEAAVRQREEAELAEELQMAAGLREVQRADLEVRRPVERPAAFTLHDDSTRARAAAEQAAIEQAAAEQAAAEQAAAEQAAAEQAAADQAAAEEAGRQAAAAAVVARLAAEAAETRRLEVERARLLVAEQAAEAERLAAAQVAEAERLAAEQQATAGRLAAAELVEARRLAAEQAEQAEAGERQRLAAPPTAPPPAPPAAPPPAPLTASPIAPPTAPPTAPPPPAGPPRTLFRMPGNAGPTDGAVAAAGALQELAASFADDAGSSAPPPQPPPAEEPPPPPMTGLGLLSTVRRDPNADTASLLRELSGLGFEDAPAPARPARPTTPPPTPTPAFTKDPKKRKGLFGR